MWADVNQDIFGLRIEKLPLLTRVTETGSMTG
jgi:hypothetical protein